MSQLARLFVFLAVFSLQPSLSFSSENSPPPRNYFGQAPPGDTAVVFAPGIISDAGYRLHGIPAISPDGKQVYWPVIPPVLMYMELTDSGWTAPVQASLPGRGAGAACFSPNGDRLYYHAAHPDGYGGLDIWGVNVTGDTIGAASNLGSPPNSSSLESQPSVTRSGDLYFTGKLDSVGFERGIYVSKVVGGAYVTPELLNDNINTPAIDYTPWISPDGDFLLFASSRPTAEEADLKLYVSFIDESGDWAEPINLSEAMGWSKPARFPALSIDGKHLFFLSDGRIFWVSATVIDRLR